MNFTCPECQQHRLEEVMTSVIVASTIIDAQDGSIDYGEQTNEGGLVDHYQCMDCGYIIRWDEESDPIDDSEMLGDWLEEQE
jgi:rubredoxin